jgi:hypothetical protein
MSQFELIEKKDEQMGLFDEEPRLENFGVTGSKLKGSQLTLTIECVTNVNDMGLLNGESWLRGVAEWLVMISGGNNDIAMSAVEQAKERLIENVE